MTAQTWLIIGIVGFSLAGALFIAAILMFIRFKIPVIIGDLTGRTATKQIEKFRQSNAASGVKSFRPDPLNVERGKLTEQVQDNFNIDPGKASAVAHPSKKLSRKGTTGQTGAANKTAGIGVASTESPAKDTDVLADGTTVLGNQGKTSNLSKATTVLSELSEETKPADITSVLSETEPADVTTILSDNEPAGATSVLSETTPANATSVLSDETPANATSVLTEEQSGNATTVLSETPTAGTAVLSQPDNQATCVDSSAAAIAFKIVKRIEVVHTSEVIT